MADDEGKTIKVRVTFSDDGGNNETLTSAATDVVEAAPTTNIPATGAPTISGTAQVGETLTADTSGIADADGVSGETFTYQWVSSDGTTDTDIEKATDSTYKLVAADQGKFVKVRVTFTDDGGNEETLTSAPTAPVWGDGLPGAPRNLNATAGNKEITLSWDSPADNGNAPATRYRIEWRGDGKDYSGSQWGTARSTNLYDETTRANLANGVKYFFRVKAENSDGNSYGPYGPASGEVSATPTSGSAVDLGTPVLSNTENLHHGMVRLDWQDIEGRRLVRGPVLPRRRRGVAGPARRGSGHRVPRIERGGEQPAWALVAEGSGDELWGEIGVVADRANCSGPRRRTGRECPYPRWRRATRSSPAPWSWERQSCRSRKPCITAWCSWTGRTSRTPAGTWSSTTTSKVESGWICPPLEWRSRSTVPARW